MLSVYNTLNKKFRFQVKLIFLLLLVSSLLETLNIGLLIPVLSGIFSEGENKYLSYIQVYFNVDEINKNFFLIIFISIIILKNIFNIYFNYKQTSFIASLKLFLNKILFSSYLNISYREFKIKNSSTITRNLVTETDNFIAVIYQYISLTLECFIIIGIFILLIWYDLKTTLICFIILSLITIVYIAIFQQYLKKIGKISFDNSAYLLQEISESLDNFKIIKLFKNKNIFIENFYKKSFLATDSKRKHMFLHTLAKPYLEIFLFSIILILLLLFQVNDLFIKNNFEKLSFYSIVFIRLIPSANRVINYLQKIKYSTASISVILNELSLAEKNINKNYDENSIEKNPIEFDFDKDLIIDSIHYSFDKNKKILNNLSLSIKSSQIIGISGASGSGKSLLADLICGLLSTNQGKIFIGENEISKNLKEWQNNIGYITQNIYLLEKSIEKNISFGFTSEQINENKIKKLIKICELETFVENLELNEKTLIGERSANISGGQKQRIGIARALYREPNILIFDESFSGIEQETAKIILENIRKNYPKTKIIIISHSEKILENVDQLYSMNNGKLDKL
jgi:ATP-binding cassette, subfamily B, bacterial PglK